MEGKRNACRLLVRRPEGKILIGIFKRNRMNNIKMDEKERQNGVEWTGLFVLIKGRGGGL
jgi:hypothetical protein